MQTDWSDTRVSASGKPFLCTGPRPCSFSFLGFLIIFLFLFYSYRSSVVNLVFFSHRIPDDKRNLCHVGRDGPQMLSRISLTRFDDINKRHTNRTRNAGKNLRGIQGPWSTYTFDQLLSRWIYRITFLRRYSEYKEKLYHVIARVLPPKKGPPTREILKIFIFDRFWVFLISLFRKIWRINETVADFRRR